MSAGAEREAEAPPSKKGGGGEEGERTKNGERGSRAAAAVKQHWDLGLRVVELVISVVCIGMIVDAINTGKIYTLNHLSHVATIYSTYSGFVIITAVLVLGASLGESVGWRTSLAFSVVGAILFVATGGLIISDWTKALHQNLYQMRPHKHYYDMMCASGVFAVLNAAIFILHSVLTFRKEANI